MVRSTAELKAALAALHTRVAQWDAGESKVFLEPVNVRLAPDYHLIVKNPMDLGTIGRKIEGDEYRSAWQYLDDMWLMLENCFLFNRPGSFHYKYGHRLAEFWEPQMERLMTVTLASHGYCCGRRRLLSGVSYRCRSSTCFVRYGSVYWQYEGVEGQDDIVFCHSHYTKLLAEIKIPKYTNGTGGDIKFNKSALVRKRHNTPLEKERFVTCGKCGWLDHEVCRLHDALAGLPYVCVHCQDQQQQDPTGEGESVKEEGEQGGRRGDGGAEEGARTSGSSSHTHPPAFVMVDELPHCHLSECIEADVRQVQADWLASPHPEPSVIAPMQSSAAVSPRVSESVGLRSGTGFSKSGSSQDLVGTSPGPAVPGATIPLPIGTSASSAIFPSVTATVPVRSLSSDAVLSSPAHLRSSPLNVGTTTCMASPTSATTTTAGAAPTSSPLSNLRTRSVSLASLSPPTGPLAPARTSSASMAPLDPIPMAVSGPAAASGATTNPSPSTSSSAATSALSSSHSTPSLSPSEPIASLSLLQSDAAAPASSSAPLLASSSANLPALPASTVTNTTTASAPAPSPSIPVVSSAAAPAALHSPAPVSAYPGNLDADSPREGQHPLSGSSGLTMGGGDLTPESGLWAGAPSLKRCISMEEVAPDCCAAPIQIRVVDHVADKCEVKANMRARYPDGPKEFPYVRKVILAFITVEGRPVCFFGMIVQEYGEDAPPPNRNTVYLSLLDSMKLPKSMMPSALRTTLYHTIVKSYLRVMGQYGFTTAHIYTCPPRRGQNYIFPFKPDHQKEISLTRLRQWYADLLTSAAAPGPKSAILGYNTIADTYPNATLTQIPYFDGDNWPDIIEDILKAEEKAEEEARKYSNVLQLVDEAFHRAVQETVIEQVSPRCVKPRDAGGFYEGHAPFAVGFGAGAAGVGVGMDGVVVVSAGGALGAALAGAAGAGLGAGAGAGAAAGLGGGSFLGVPGVGEPTRKRRKSSSSLPRNVKAKTSPDERLCNLMSSIKRDFLVVKLRPAEPRLVVTDPNLPCMGDEHTVISFLRCERLEFSSLRHAKFATMLLLRYLSRESKAGFAERWPKVLRAAALAADVAGGPQDSAGAAGDSGKGESIAQKGAPGIERALSAAAAARARSTAAVPMAVDPVSAASGAGAGVGSGCGGEVAAAAAAAAVAAGSSGSSSMLTTASATTPA